MFDYHAYHAQLYDNQNPGQGWQYWGDVSNRWQAVFALLFGAVTAAFTYALVEVSRSQRDLLQEANTNSTNALAETKRSVDAFITQANAFMVIDGFTRRLPTLKDDDGEATFTMKNYGPSPAQILGFAYHFQAADREDLANVSWFKTYAAVLNTVKVGDTFGTDAEVAETRMSRPLVIPRSVLMEHTERDNMLLVTLQFLYHTPFGVFHLRITEIIGPNGEIDPSLVDGLHFNLTDDEWTRRFPPVVDQELIEKLIKRN